MKKMLFLLLALLPAVGLRAQEQPAQDPDLLYATELLEAGARAPGFTLQDIDGKSVKISDFRGKNVVLIFWATWCPDCRAEIPQLKQLYARTDPAGTVFVSISFDRKFDALCTYVKEKEVPGVQLFDPAGMKESTIGAAYGIKWIPSLYLIGPDGKVKLGTVVLDKISAALEQ